MDNSNPGVPPLAVFGFVFTIRGTSEIPTECIIFPIRKPLFITQILTVFYLYFVRTSKLEKLIKHFLIFYLHWFIDINKFLYKVKPFR